MIPFGQSVLLWRLDRHFTQAELAEKARIPRPNLSAIESGKREVSLKTLRALAEALGVRPGVLVDGIGPGKNKNTSGLSRQKMERIARAVVLGTPLPNPDESELAQPLAVLTRLSKNKRTSLKQIGLAVLRLAYLPRPVFKSLIARIREQEELQ